MRWFIMRVDTTPVVASLCVSSGPGANLVSFTMDMDPLLINKVVSSRLQFHSRANKVGVGGAVLCPVCDSPCVLTNVGNPVQALTLATTQGITMLGDPASAYAYLETLL